MSTSKNTIFLAALLITTAVLSSFVGYLLITGNIQGMTIPEPVVLFGIVNAFSTIALAAVALVNMLESKKVRGEMVRPRLALEPAFFEFDMKTGDIIGFTCLNLVNGGTVARDVEIDFCWAGKCSALYATSVGTNDRVQIWNGQFSELGSQVTVDVRYRNMFDKELREHFKIDIESIKKGRRKFVPVLNPATAK